MAHTLSYLCGLLLIGQSACVRASTVEQQSPPVAQEASTTLAIQIPEDTETLPQILRKGGHLEQFEAWNGKALFIKVDDSQQPVRFQPFSYRALYKDTNKNQKQDSEDEGFFNPASTVKVAIASLVLEQLQQRKISKEAEYRVAGTFTWYSIETDLKKMLVISDNDAANRLILFLGFQYLNETMRSRGLKQYTVTRLMLNKGTLIDSPPIEIRYRDAITRIPKRTVTDKFDCYEVGEKSGNCASAHDLAAIFMRVIYPKAFPPTEGFDLRPEDRKWMQQVMSQTPQQSGFNYENTFCRFLDPLGQEIANPSGRLLSKCGIGLFSYTFLETSFLETDQGQKFFIIFAITPPRTIAKTQIINWLNETSQLILTQL